MNHSEIFINGLEQPWESTEPGVKRQILAHNEDLMLVKVAFETGAIGTAHQHIHTQTSYLLSGKFEVTINGKTQILSAGDSFYVPPASLHGVVCLETGILLDAFNPRREEFFNLTPTLSKREGVAANKSIKKENPSLLERDLGGGFVTSATALKFAPDLLRVNL